MASLINEYTVSEQAFIGNKALRANLKKEVKVLQVEKYTQLYRGTTVTWIGACLKQTGDYYYFEGDVVSTSKCPSQAYNFAMGSGIFLIINEVEGYDISALSKHPQEEEVLLLGTKLYVSKIQRVEKGVDITVSTSPSKVRQKEKDLLELLFRESQKGLPKPKVEVPRKSRLMKLLLTPVF